MTGDVTNARRRVLVTGGGRGVGAAIVTTLAQAGFDVVFTYRSSTEAAEAVMATLADLVPDARIEARLLDLGDKNAVETFARGLEEERFYGVVHNAGQSYDTLAVMMDQDRAEEAMQVNFWSLTRLAKATLRQMTQARDGRLVVIGSIAALRASQGNAAYAASKAALLGYIRTLAIETARRGVTVNYVAPGFVDTDMLAPYAAHRATMEKQIPAGRFGKPEDVAGVVAFLLSPAAAYISGAVLPVDGALSAALAVHR